MGGDGRTPVQQDVAEALGLLRDSILANLSLQISMMTRRSTPAAVIQELELHRLRMSNDGDLPAVEALVSMMITALKSDRKREPRQ